jgi:hypothetical protein
MLPLQDGYIQFMTHAQVEIELCFKRASDALMSF